MVRTVGAQVARRLVEGIIFLLLLVTALFFLIRLNGNPAAILAGPNATPDQVATVERLYGFDHPLIVQYLDFIRRFAELHFGRSMQEQTSALGIAVSHARKTLWLCALATVANVAISTPLGVLLGKHAGNRRGRTANRIVAVAQGVQFYILGMVLLTLFAVRLHLVPATGTSRFGAWILPTASLTWLVVPRLTRVVASVAEDVWRSDYVRAATAFGLSERAIWWRTVTPNVAVPIIATAGTQFTLLISGAVIIEGLFGINGLGQALIQAVGNADFPVLAASVTVVGVIVFAVTSLSDVLYQVADPRLRRAMSP